MKKKLLGHVGVDSGQLIITDPCYINSEWWNEEIRLDKTGDFKPSKHPFSYPAICIANQVEKHQINYKKGHPGLAVTFSSGYGDGFYPVYGYFNTEGRCMKVEIDCGITKAQAKFFKAESKL